MMYNVEKIAQTIGDAIQNACHTKNIAPTTLAKQAQISSSTMSYIINGKTVPHLYTLLQICNVLEVPVTEFLAGEESENDMDIQELSTEEQEWIRFLRNLPEDKKQWLLTSKEMLERQE